MCLAPGRAAPKQPPSQRHQQHLIRRPNFTWTWGGLCESPGLGGHFLEPASLPRSEDEVSQLRQRSPWVKRPCRRPLGKAGTGGSEELGLRRNLGGVSAGTAGRKGVREGEECWSSGRRRRGRGTGREEGGGEGWDGMGWVKGRKEQRLEWKEKESGGAWPPLPEETRLNWSHYSW